MTFLDRVLAGLERVAAARAQAELDTARQRSASLEAQLDIVRRAHLRHITGHPHASREQTRGAFITVTIAIPTNWGDLTSWEREFFLSSAANSAAIKALTTAETP